MAINLDYAHANMVTQQIIPSYVFNTRVIKALQNFKRDQFVAE